MGGPGLHAKLLKLICCGTRATFWGVGNTKRHRVGIVKRLRVSPGQGFLEAASGHAVE
jgi:hypothetical protein